MLTYAIEKKDELIKLIRGILNDEKFKYYVASSYMNKESLVVEFDTWNKMHMVSVDNEGEIIGEMKYSICRDTLNCHGLSVINFGKSEDMKSRLIFANDMKKFISDIFNIYNFKKLNWTVVVGNEAESNYDRLIKRVNGRIVGVLRNDVKLFDGKYCDLKMYELLRDDYLNRKKVRA